jgi:hypothetical protein
MHLPSTFQVQFTEPVFSGINLEHTFMVTQSSAFAVAQLEMHQLHKGCIAFNRTTWDT